MSCILQRGFLLCDWRKVLPFPLFKEFPAMLNTAEIDSLSQVSLSLFLHGRVNSLYTGARKYLVCIILYHLRTHVGIQACGGKVVNKDIFAIQVKEKKVCLTRLRSFTLWPCWTWGSVLLALISCNPAHISHSFLSPFFVSLYGQRFPPECNSHFG